jgi:hypothetical protein
VKINELLIEFKNVRERAYARITIRSLRELALRKEKIDKYKLNADYIQEELLLEACTNQFG